MFSLSRIAGNRAFYSSILRRKKPPAQMKICCVMDAQADVLLRRAFDTMGLSARGHDRILRVARTIADLDQSEIIGAMHIAEAVQLRCLDKKYFQ